MDHEVRVEVRPPWPFALRGGSPDGLMRRRGTAVQRFFHIGDAPVLAGAVQAAGDRVIVGARSPSPEAAIAGIDRMRFALGVDDDLAEFHDLFAGDPVIGRAVRERKDLRVRRRPVPFEALFSAIAEQLIEYEYAVQIQRRMIRALGRRCPRTGLRDAPAAAVLAVQAPARLASFELNPRRAMTMRRAAEEVARGRVDLLAPGHESGWRRLRAINGIGPWTIEMLALYGQGRLDQVPAGDLGYLKLVGRLSTGNPHARADEAEVRGFFERYGAWKGLAAEHLRCAAAHGWVRWHLRVPVPRP